MNERGWEFVLAGGVTLALLAMLAYERSGRTNAAGSAPLSLGNLVSNDTNPATQYAPGNVNPPGLDLSGLDFSFPITITHTDTTITAPSIPGVPVNMSSGSPQCGCSGSGADMGSLAAAQAGMYAASIAALESAGRATSAPNLILSPIEHAAAKAVNNARVFIGQAVKPIWQMMGFQTPFG